MTVNCNVCGDVFTPARSDARYCSGRCRTQAFRIRRDGDKPTPRRGPIREDWNRRVWDLQRVLDSLERVTRDDRFREAVQTERIMPGHLDMLGKRLDEIREQIAAVTSE